MKALFSGQHDVRTSRALRRGMVLIAVSVLAHIVVLHWVTESPLLAWPENASEPVIEADMLPPPPAAAPAVPQAAKALKPVLKKKPRRASAHPRSASPVVPPREKDISSTAISVPENSSSEPAKDVQQDVEPVPPKAEQSAAAPAEEKSTPAATPAYKIDPPPSGDLHYDVIKTSANGGSMSGRGRISWHREGGSYTINGEVSWLFITALKFSSEGALDEYGVSPVLYSQKSFRRSATNTHFQHERNIVSFSASENTYPRVGGEQDRASIIWQLAGIGRADEAQFVPGKEFEIMVAGVRDEEPWQLHVIGKEEISVDIGNVDAWHLVRTPKPGSYDQTLDIWLSPTHEWYPVKLRYTEPNGDHLDLVLSKIGAAAPN